MIAQLLLEFIYWMYLNVFMINSIVHFQAIYKPQTFLNTFSPSLLPPLGRVSLRIKNHILQLMAEESRAQKRDSLRDLPFLVAGLHSFTASSAAKEQNQIRNEDMDYASKQTLSLYTDRHSPPKIPCSEKR